MFDIFKQEKSFLTRAKEKSSFRYVLQFDINGAYIEVCDNKNKPINTIDYRVYNGIDREILQLIEELSKESFFQINWENDSEQIYLHKYPKLLELLRNSDKLYTQDGKNLKFENQISKITLNIIPKDSDIIVVPTLENNNNFTFVSGSYVLIEDTIKQIHFIGENFSQLSSFDTIIKNDKLEELLTIFVTHFENIDIKYENYTIDIKDEKKLIKPAIIFEKVTKNDELILRISATVGKLSPDFFNNFNITKIVLVNELEKTRNYVIEEKADF
jgi:hypothetical protein